MSRHVSPCAQAKITRAPKGNPKTNMGSTKNIFQFARRCSTFSASSCFLTRRAINSLTFNSCWSLRSGKRNVFRFPVVYCVSVTWSMSMLLSNEESHEEKAAPFSSFLLTCTTTTVACGWFATYKSVAYAAGKDESRTAPLTNICMQRNRKKAAHMNNMQMSKENESPSKQLCQQDCGDDQVIT